MLSKKISGKKRKRKGEEKKCKVKEDGAVSFLNAKTISKIFCFLCMPELQKLTYASEKEGCEVINL